MNRLVVRLGPVLRGTANSHPSFCFRAPFSTQETTSSHTRQRQQGQEDMEQKKSHDCGDHEKQSEDQSIEDTDDQQEYKNPVTGEIGGPKGPEPTRFGDWEKGGRCYDF